MTESSPKTISICQSMDNLNNNNNLSKVERIKQIKKAIAYWQGIVEKHQYTVHLFSDGVNILKRELNEANDRWDVMEIRAKSVVLKAAEKDKLRNAAMDKWDCICKLQNMMEDKAEASKLLKKGKRNVNSWKKKLKRISDEKADES